MSNSLPRRRRSIAKQHNTGRSIHAFETLESRTLLAVTPVVGIYTGRADASETDPTGDGRGSFVVKRAQRTTKPLTVQYYVRSTSTAKNGVDVQPLSGTVTIPARKYSAVVHVIPINDSTDENTEILTLVVKAGAYTINHSKASVNVLDNDGSSNASWFNEDTRYRSSFTINSGSFARSNQPIDHAINFTDILGDVSASGSLIKNSIRVIETNAAGTAVVDSSVPFQFDQASDYNASSNAAGNLVVLVEGNTNASTTRYYQVYFDTTGSFSAPSFTSLVTTTDNVTDEGFSSVRVVTQLADYYYQKAEGGFSSIVDKDGNDWITWHSTGGSDGAFRGVPNMGPAGYHPGLDHDVTTTIVSQGPLKTTLLSTDPAGNKVQWEFYPQFVRATVIDFKQDYYFLYEGTPGGSVNGNDTVIRSDGTTTNSNEEWTDADGLGTSNGEEWVYFRDSAVTSGGRYLYFVHNDPDNIRDTYWEMDGNMTVYGFGRFTSFPDHNTTTQLLPSGDGINNVFTFGLANGGGDFNTASDLINGKYRDVTISAGDSEAQ